MPELALSSQLPTPSGPLLRATRAKTIAA